MVDEGFLTLEQLTQALAEQNKTGRPLGKVLVELGFVSEGAVANALAEQHGGLLKTEFGISAGLHAVQGGATRKAQAEVAAPAAAKPDPAAAVRVAELELHLQEVLTERNAFAQKLNELQARLAEAAQAHEAEVAHVTACAAARITELEAEAETALADRSELETAVGRGATRISELQDELAELRERPEPPQAEQAAEDATAGRAHLLFVPSSSGYALIEFEGPDPASGSLLDVNGVTYVVRRVGASPFPGGRLRCVFLDPV